MNIHYVTDERGKRVAVIVPIHEWEALGLRNMEFADDVPEDEIVEAEAVWKEFQADPSSAKTVEQVIKEQLEERDD
ncbi:MAG: hypothetical protein AB1641_28490 [Thermodesulfobacteriota bacterium]